MAGVVYDSNEVANLQSILDKQNTTLQAIDNEKQTQDKKFLTYAIIGGGAIVLLVLFKMVVSKK